MNIKTLIALLSIVLSTSLAIAEQNLKVSSYVVYPNSCYKPENGTYKIMDPVGNRNLSEIFNSKAVQCPLCPPCFM